MNYYIGDTHWFHDNALAYDNRPFKDAEENNKVIVDNINNACSPYDDLWLLGDISHGNVTKTIELLKQLNPALHLCVGNHDRRFLKNKQFRDCFVEICDYKELDIDNGKKLILCHYPIVAFNGQFRGNVHLYAHVHNTPQWNMIEHFKRTTEEERGNGSCRMFNTGCMIDYINYVPRTLEEILAANKKD